MCKTNCSKFFHAFLDMYRILFEIILMYTLICNITIDNNFNMYINEFYFENNIFKLYIFSRIFIFKSRRKFIE